MGSSHGRSEAAASGYPGLRTAGLFAGIGGVELGLELAGHRAELLCEIDPGARAVLEARFGDRPCLRDVREIRALPPEVELVAGGFPCQDLSQAGRAGGIEGARSGLIFEIFRLVERCRTPWVLLENVPFMLDLAKGRALEVLVHRFEELGYHWAYRVVDSRSFGLPQRRRRIYFLAAEAGTGRDPRAVLFADEAGPPAVLEANHTAGRRRRAPVLGAQACGFYWTEGLRGLGWAENAVPTLKGGSSVGVPSPPAIVLPTGEVVTPHIRDAERLQGFDADWTLPAEEVVRPGLRWKLVGNAVSVPVSAWIGGRLAEPGAPVEARRERLEHGRRWPTAAWNTGRGRFALGLSEWPLAAPAPNLDAFLLHPPKPLSIRATTGFLGRARRARLRFPAGFLETLEAHLEAMRRRAA